MALRSIVAMTIDEAKELQRKWGNKPCAHPDIIEERESRPGTEAKWRCVRCGRLVDFDEWRNSHKRG
jgi:hypothetical protein